MPYRSFVGDELLVRAGQFWPSNKPAMPSRGTGVGGTTRRGVIIKENRLLRERAAGRSVCRKRPAAEKEISSSAQSSKERNLGKCCRVWLVVCLKRHPFLHFENASADTAPEAAAVPDPNPRPAVTDEMAKKASVARYDAAIVQRCSADASAGGVAVSVRRPDRAKRFLPAAI